MLFQSDLVSIIVNTNDLLVGKITEHNLAALLFSGSCYILTPITVKGLVFALLAPTLTCHALTN